MFRTADNTLETRESLVERFKRRLTPEYRTANARHYVESTAEALMAALPDEEETPYSSSRVARTLEGDVLRLADENARVQAGRWAITLFDEIYGVLCAGDTPRPHRPTLAPDANPFAVCREWYQDDILRKMSYRLFRSSNLLSNMIEANTIAFAADLARERYPWDEFIAAWDMMGELTEEDREEAIYLRKYARSGAVDSGDAASLLNVNLSIHGFSMQGEHAIVWFDRCRKRLGGIRHEGKRWKIYTEAYPGAGVGWHLDTNSVLRGDGGGVRTFGSYEAAEAAYDEYVDLLP